MNKQLEFPFRNNPITVSVARDHYQGLLTALTKFEQQINAALAYAEGTHTYDDIVGMVMSGRLIIISKVNSFLMLEITHYPQTKHLNVFLAGGDLQEILHTQDELEAIAMANGCSAIVMTGRKGWVKPLEKQGWRYSHTSIIYEVKNDG